MSEFLTSSHTSPQLQCVSCNKSTPVITSSSIHSTPKQCELVLQLCWIAEILWILATLYENSMVVRYGGTLTVVFLFVNHSRSPSVSSFAPSEWNAREFVSYWLRGVQQFPCCCGPMYKKDEVGHLRLCIHEDTMISQLLHTLLQV
jgi:hypothetical protein